MSLFSRLLVLMIAVSIGPLIPTGALLVYYQNKAQEQILNSHYTLASVSSSAIKQYVGNISQKLIFTSRLKVALDSQSVEFAKSVLRDAAAQNPDFLLAAVLDKHGREKIKAGKTNLLEHFGVINLSQSAAFASAKKSKAITLSHFYSRYAVPIASIIYPLDAENYFFAIVSFRDIWTEILRQKIGKTGGIYLCGLNGNIFQFKGQPSPGIKRETLKKLLANGKKGKIEKLTTNRAVYVGAYGIAKNANLAVLILQNRKEAFFLINLITWLAVFLILALSAAAYFASLSFAHKLAKPLLDIIEGARRVENKNFKTPVDNSDVEELSQVISAFNMMMGNLQKYENMHLDKLFEEKRKVDIVISLIKDGIVLFSQEEGQIFKNKTADYILNSAEFKKPFGRNLKEFLKDKNVSTDILSVLFDGRETRHFRIKKESFAPSKSKGFTLLIFADVTQEKEIDRIKEDFFNSIAHDLRAPLLGMQGYMRLLETCSDEGEKKEYLSVMRTSSKKILSLVEDVLESARMQAGAVKAIIKSFSLEETAQSVFRDLAPLAGEKRITLSFSKDKSAPAEIRADRKFVERALNNLASNSIRYTPTGGRIIIRYEHIKNFHKITVEDNGMGIPKDKLSAVFEKFHQIDNDANKSSGYGLGLAIVKMTAEMHNGEVSARSDKKGTAITITLSDSL